MDSEVDTSILNSVNIKRFTKSVLDEYGADIDRSNSAKWRVTFPDELARQLDREDGTLVFDPADRELGAGDLLVQPGTKVFSALLDQVTHPGSVGYIRLTGDSLQVNPPRVLQESELAVEVSDFRTRTSDDALSFHFQVQFETVASFHNEEMFSVTVDPDTQTRLPELTARLTSHLPQLLQENSEHSPRDIPEPKIRQAYEEAQQAVIDRSQSILSELKGEAEESASERIDEISDWYEQRRQELDEQLKDQRQEIQKWKQKRRKARKDSTRTEYIQNRKQAERDLEQLKDTVQSKKQELADKETSKIDEVINRHEVAVDVSLLGITVVTYVRGALEISVESNHSHATVEVDYLPATDDFRGLDCHACSQDLTTGILPQLCATGHLVGDPCSTTCRQCGLTVCDDCQVDVQFTECDVCWEALCTDCVTTCGSCGSQIGSAHSGSCSECSDTTCQLCGEGCYTCGAFRCESHLTWCDDCERYHCDSHLSVCTSCGATRCEQHLHPCNACGDTLCSTHATACDTCGNSLCEKHLQRCGVCPSDAPEEQNGFCSTHIIRCTVGDQIICPTHQVTRTLGDGHICEEHRTTCTTCGTAYATDVLSSGQCSACRSLGEVDGAQIPNAFKDEFRSVTAGMNDAYMVILGKQLIGRNRVIVYNRETGEETNRQSAGMLKQLMGKYE